MHQQSTALAQFLTHLISIDMADNSNLSMPPILLAAQIHREMLDYHLLYEQRISLLRQTLQGLATNATRCKMCQAHNEIYEAALARDEELQQSK